MRPLQMLASWIWRLAAAGIAYTLGMMIGGGLTAALGLEPVRLPVPLDPAAAMPLLVLGGMALALGLAAMATGLPGGRWRRWAFLAAFAFVVNGVCTVIEASIFSTLGGEAASALANLPASLLCALAVVWLFPARSAAGATGAVGAFLRQRPPASLAGRLLLAWLAFPFFYFLFGMVIAPIVTPYYEQLDFLIIPPMPVLLSVLFFRSALFLLVSLPIVIYWNRSRGSLALALGLGHFTAVGLSGLIQATFFPAVMQWTHGVEILADSLCYGAALAWLLFAAAATPTAVAGESPDAASSSPTTGDSGRRRRTGGAAAFALKVVALAVVLVLVSALGAALFMGSSGATAVESGGEAAAAAGTTPLIALGVLLAQTLALAYLVTRSRWGGWQLIVTVTLLYFGTASFMGLIETVAYPAATLGGMLSGVLMMSAFSAVVFSPILVWTLGKGRKPRAEEIEANPRLSMPWSGWVWRMGAGAAIYLALYYLFGYFVAWKDPAVREFYGGTDPGSFFAQMSSAVQAQPWMVPFQYLRGLLWVALALPVIRMMRGRDWETGLALSLLFAVPAHYLLFPNPVMPASVRMAHLVETLPYQFLFGWLLAWLFVPRDWVPSESIAEGREAAAH